MQKSDKDTFNFELRKEQEDIVEDAIEMRDTLRALPDFTPATASKVYIIFSARQK